MEKAKGHEKKYEWLWAIDYYEKAVDLAVKRKLSMAAELHEKIGFCYNKAALQASTNIVFKKHLKRSIRVYKEGEFSGKTVVFYWGCGLSNRL